MKTLDMFGVFVSYFIYKLSLAVYLRFVYQFLLIFKLKAFLSQCSWRLQSLIWCCNVLHSKLVLFVTFKCWQSCTTVTLFGEMLKWQHRVHRVPVVIKTQHRRIVNDFNVVFLSMLHISFLWSSIGFSDLFFRTNM